MEQIDTLKKNGVIVKIIGKKYVEKIIEPDDFSEVQAVITIGKTVQYALASGKPVYCYDHFGGPGWLHEDNFKKAEYFNFNGSCSKQKSSLDISNEILEDFKEAEKFCRSNWKKLSGRYNLDLYLEDILANSKPNNISKISDIFKIEALQQNCFHTKDKKRLRKFRKVIVILVLLHIVLPIVYLNI